MKKKLSNNAKKAIRQLRQQGSSIKEVMKELTVSRNSVLRWEGREDMNYRCRAPKKTRQKLPLTLHQVVTEAGRWFRWPPLEFRGHLSVFFPEVGQRGGTGHLQLKGRPKADYKGTSDSVYNRIFTEAGLKGIGRKNSFKTGTLAIHGIQVCWTTPEGKSSALWVLLLVERSTGYANVLLYETLTAKWISRVVSSFGKKFENVSGHQIQSVQIVTDSTGKPTVPITMMKEGNSSAADGKGVPSQWIINGHQVPLELDPPTTGTGQALQIAKQYDCVERIRDDLKVWLNSYNIREGKQTRLSKKKIHSPFEKIRQLHSQSSKEAKTTSLSESAIKRKMKHTGIGRSPTRRT